MLLHENARPHVVGNVKDFLEQQKINIWFQTAYSPDISPLDFVCFVELKRRFRGIHHQNQERFETTFEGLIDDLNKEHAALGVQHLTERWQWVIDCKDLYL